MEPRCERGEEGHEVFVAAVTLVGCDAAAGFIEDFKDGHWEGDPCDSVDSD